MLTVALATLAVPASALATSGTGTVLSVTRSDHVIEVVDAGHVVHAYRYRRLANIRDGSRIRFRVAGANITAVHTLGRARTIAFYGKVVRSGVHGLVLRLADGTNLTLGPRRLAHTHASAPRIARAAHIRWAAAASSVSATPVTINIEGLQPGETVLVTESVDAQGNPIITIELTGAVGGGPVSEQQLRGVVTDIQNDTFQVTTADGSVLNLHMAQDTLANLNLSYCDSVTVSYHGDSGLLIADSVQDSGPSSSGSCGDGSSSGNDMDAIGTITSVSGASVTIDQGGGQGTLTFAVDDPSITDGFAVGDVVDVTYTQLADGSLDASDVEYVENDATGLVTAVSGAAITIAGDAVGSPGAFTVDPSSGLFSGVLVGDEVDITYHTGAAGNVVDSVDDAGPLGG
jgi:hypothetical protein